MDSGRGRTALVGLLAMIVAVAGIALSVAGQQLGSPFLESRVGPGVTLLAAVAWIGFRALLGRRR